MAVATTEAPTRVELMQGTSNSVTSKDGTTIGYRQSGHGPGIVMLHGSMEWSESHVQLAEALADTYTVYLPDRRGRGMSGPHGKDYSIQKEVEDVDALLTETGAHYIFGVSSGALVALQSALSLDAIHKAVIFEPPLIVNGSLSTAFIARYNKELADGDVIGALVTAMLGAQMGPSVFQAVPRGLLKMLTKLGVASEDKKAGAGDITMRMLAPTLRYDFQLASELAEKAKSFEGIRAQVLLLGGSKSPAYMKIALDELAKVLPNARRVELEGVAHGATGNKDRGGQPERVAQELCRFFG